jgi:soluble lytic murein transglycosylase-like protein
MRFSIVVLFFIALMAFKKIDSSYNVPQNVIYSQPTELELFLQHMAQRESNNNPQVVNKFGMMGKYQFSPSTVRMLGFLVTPNEFLSNSELQDSVMVAYLRANHTDLQQLINRYDGRVIKGVKITRAGVLAAAHLGGSGNVRQWFASDDPNGRTDANGTSLRHYMVEFSKYKLEL